MKLILCRSCGDIVATRAARRTCQCGKSWSTYTNARDAIYGGEAIPLGLANKSLATALANRPASAGGSRFEAFVIPIECPTYRKVPA